MTSANAEQLSLVGVVMGSDSDLKTLKPAIDVLDDFSVKHEVRILSAHRTPTKMFDFASKAESNGFKVIIAGAGGAAHLPGMIASLTSIPVIGVPVETRTLSGVDSMHSILQMPGGIPVATVAINGSLNAGLLAVQILGISNKGIREKISNYRKKLHDQVISKDQKLVEIGAVNYIKEIL